MLRDEVLENLRADKEALDGFGVKVIGVFGSVARGEEGPDSDLDILVDYDEKKIPGLFGLVDLKNHLEALLGRSVDLIVRDGIYPDLKENILKDAIYA